MQGRLKQEVYTGGTLDKTTDYIGEYVFEDGSLDYLLQEEGRVAYESGNYQYEYFIKDHLGNVRQVIRAPNENERIATMEMSAAPEEEQEFEQIDRSRQLGPEHNVTRGGNQVAWLNAGRGRSLGPSRSQEVQAGDSVRLSVHGKYRDRRRRKMNPGSFVSSGARERLLTDLGEFSKAAMRAGGANAITIFNMIDLLMKDLQKKQAPESYMMYALYDSDSVLYKTGKQVLSRNAADQHEELEEELYIEKDGYIETFLVNETEEDVWYDNFSVQSTTALIVQETHYDPWGVELEGLGYQYGGIKKNKYLYSGKEKQDDLSLNWYHYGTRYYDPQIGRWSVIDPSAENYFAYTPYNFVGNNPIRRIDPDGNDGWDIVKGIAVALLDNASGGLLNARGLVSYNDAADYNQGQDIGDKASIAIGGAEIATGGGMESGGGGLVAVGLAAEIPSGGGSTPVVVVGGVTVAAGTGLIGHGGIMAGNGADNLKNQKGRVNVHGNSKSSTKEQHGYKIKNNKTGETTEYGISGQKLNKDGSSPRIKQKLRTKYGNDGNYSGEVTKTGIKNRNEGLNWEKQQVQDHKNATGQTPRRQLRPKIDE